MENYNQYGEGGGWVVIGWKVYDVEPFAEQVYIPVHTGFLVVAMVTRLVLHVKEYVIMIFIAYIILVLDIG